jgi:hypothetical protein
MTRESIMKNILAFVILVVLAAGTAAAIMSVQPQSAAATCQNPPCVAPAGFGDFH